MYQNKYRDGQGNTIFPYRINILTELYSCPITTYCYSAYKVNNGQKTIKHIGKIYTGEFTKKNIYINLYILNYFWMV